MQPRAVRIFASKEEGPPSYTVRSGSGALILAMKKACPISGDATCSELSGWGTGGALIPYLAGKARRRSAARCVSPLQVQLEFL